MAFFVFVKAWFNYSKFIEIIQVFPLIKTMYLFIQITFTLTYTVL